MLKNYLPSLVAVLILASTLVVTGSSGTPDSPAPPDSTYSYTIEDIYDRLESGATGSQSTFTEPISGPISGTMHTLNQVMEAAPQADDVGGAEPENVLGGATYWGLRTAAWGRQTGAMPDNGAVTLVPTITEQTISAGYHNGRGYVEGDPDLFTVNIRSGVELFGVHGDSSVVDTSSGTAGMSDILAGKTAWVEGSELTGNRPLSPVPSTGQKRCWDDQGNQVPCDGSNQDGELRMGVAWPTPRFTDNGDGTVTDNLTQLIWLKNANCFGTLNWPEALSEAAALSDGACGLSDGSAAGDWRLPNIRELHGLVDFSQYDPALPVDQPFANAESYYYWSSTTRPHIASNVWCVYMEYGEVNAYGKAGNYLLLWPVRGGQ